MIDKAHALQLRGWKCNQPLTAPHSAPTSHTTHTCSPFAMSRRASWFNPVSQVLGSQL